MAAEIIWGYQRVADGDACDFCAMLDGAQFRTDDPMPIHPGCGCGVEPVEYTRLSGKKAPKPRKGSTPATKITGDAGTGMKRGIETAAKQIDDTLDTSSVPNELKYREQGDGSWGNYDVYTGKVEIDPTIDVDLAKMSYIHERGHLADLPPEISKIKVTAAKITAKTELTPVEAAAREALLAEIKRSPTYKALQAAKKAIPENFANPATRKRMNFWLNYLMSDHELIARAFAQHVGTSHPGLKTAWKKFSEGYARDTGYASSNNIWADGEFDAIRSYLVKYFDVRGRR